MSALDTISKWSFLPGAIRHSLQEIRLRPVVVDYLRQADAARQLGNERRRHCATRYALNWLGSRLSDIASQTTKLAHSARRQSLASWGMIRFETLARGLRATIESIGEVCQQDEAHERAARELRADRDRLVREATQLLVGVAETEFRQYDAQFEQRFAAFPASRDLAAVIQSLKALRESAAAMDRLVERAKHVEKGIQIATVAFERIDRRTVSSDPYSDEVYVRTAQTLRTLSERRPSAEVERSVALLNKVNQNLDTLVAQADHVRRNAAVEVELWRRVARICPRTTAPFAGRLARIPDEPSGDALADWAVLKRAIENTVNQAAHETRSANAKAIRDRTFAYEWLDPKQRRLQAFARICYRALAGVLNPQNCPRCGQRFPSKIEECAMRKSRAKDPDEWEKLRGKISHKVCTCLEPTSN